MGKRILVVSPTPSHPQNAGNRARIFNLLSALVERGHKIYFVHVKKERFGDNKRMREEWSGFHSLNYHCSLYNRKQLKLESWKKGILRIFLKDIYFPYKIDDWWDSAVDSFIINLHRKHYFEVIIAEYVFFSKVLDLFGQDVLKVIDTHDIFTDRHKKYIKYGVMPGFFYTTKREEAKGLNRSDLILAIQENEANFYKTITNKKVSTIGHPVKLKTPKTKKRLNKSILFVGSNNIPNVKSISYFIKNIFPKLKKNEPNLSLYIVGNIKNNKDFQVIEMPSGCKAIGEVDNLGPYYQYADIVVNPVLFGSGLNIKMIESLGYGKPTVTTPVGAKGLEDGAGDAFWVANNDENFVEIILNLLQDVQSCNKLGYRAYEFAENYNANCLRVLTEEIERA